jgi:hypothetical protein
MGAELSKTLSEFPFTSQNAILSRVVNSLCAIIPEAYQVAPVQKLRFVGDTASDQSGTKQAHSLAMCKSGQK